MRIALVIFVLLLAAGYMAKSIMPTVLCGLPVGQVMVLCNTDAKHIPNTRP